MSHDVASPPPADAASCPVCGGPVPDRTGKPGRRAAWCSKGCRQRAWRARAAGDRAARAAAELSDRIAGTGYGDVQAAGAALGEAVLAMCEDGDPDDVADMEAALMSGHRWEHDVAQAARRLAAAATRVAELADAHATQRAELRRARAVVRRPPAPRGRDDESPSGGGIVANTAAKASATKPATTLSASGLSRALTRLGFARAVKVPGGRGGVLSPITEGFKVWGRGSAVVVDHLPADAEDRHDRLTAMATALTAAGYTVTPASDRGDLHVTRPPSGPGGIVATTAVEASATNHPATPPALAAAAIDADDLFDAIEDVLADVRDAPGIPQDVLQDVPGVPGTSFAAALEDLAAAHQAASGDVPVDDLAAAAAVVVRARPPYLPARADAALTRLQEVVAST
ncbi:hypothetical protein [Actinomadura sp. 3N407]|uniref:hypothetical protein n=1 Tax=Actinomadura sp. 3N407 TaxID=3457423 RepID=UPI003FCD5DB2